MLRAISFLHMLAECLGVKFSFCDVSVPPTGSREQEWMTARLKMTCVLQVLPENRVLRARMISFLHRLVECLGDRLLPYLPAALSALLPMTADASTVSDVCALLSQLAIRYKAALAPLLAKV